jgi:DNA-binding transcriptional LysR family regulator
MELALGQLVVLDVEKFPIMRNWYIVYREGKRLSIVAQSFREFVLQEAAQTLQLPAL